MAYSAMFVGTHKDRPFGFCKWVSLASKAVLAVRLSYAWPLLVPEPVVMLQVGDYGIRHAHFHVGALSFPAVVLDVGYR